VSSENSQHDGPVALAGSVVAFRHRGCAVSFFVENEHDVIQCHHAQGVFYEREELSIIEEYFPRGGVLLDIGANIGNHSVFAGYFLFPSQIIVIEPNPAACRILDINIRLNNFSRLVDMSLSRFGFADAAGLAVAVTPPGNLGGTRLDACQRTGGLPLVRGDDVLLGRRVDFIKLDVEGMELRVLDGLSEVIRAHRPGMLVEVDARNNEGFEQFLARMGYAIRVRCKRYQANENFLILPVERA
jgi:FkbM family methyltransferase